MQTFKKDSACRDVYVGVMVKVVGVLLLIGLIIIGGFFMFKSIGSAFKPVTDTLSLPFKLVNGAVDGIGDLGKLGIGALKGLRKRRDVGNATTVAPPELCRQNLYYLKSACEVLNHVWTNEKYSELRDNVVFYSYAVTTGVSVVHYRCSEFTILSTVIYVLNSTISFVLVLFQNPGMAFAVSLALAFSDAIFLPFSVLYRYYTVSQGMYRLDCRETLTVSFLHLCQWVPATMMMTYLQLEGVIDAIPCCLAIGITYGLRHLVMMMTWWKSIIMIVAHVGLTYGIRFVTPGAKEVGKGLNLFFGILCGIEGLVLMAQLNFLKSKWANESSDLQAMVYEVVDKVESSDSEDDIYDTKVIHEHTKEAEESSSAGLRNADRVHAKMFRQQWQLDTKILYFGVLLICLAMLPTVDGCRNVLTGDIEECGATVHDLSYRQFTDSPFNCVFENVTYYDCDETNGRQLVIERDRKKGLVINNPLFDAQHCLTTLRAPCCVGSPSMVLIFNETKISEYNVIIGTESYYGRVGNKPRYPNGKKIPKNELVGYCASDGNGTIGNNSEYNMAHTRTLTAFDPRTFAIEEYHFPMMVNSRAICCGITAEGEFLKFGNILVTDAEYLNDRILINRNTSVMCPFSEQLECLFSMRLFSGYVDVSYSEDRRRKRAADVGSWSRLTYESGMLTTLESSRLKFLGNDEIPTCSAGNTGNQPMHGIVVCPDGLKIIICITPTLSGDTTSLHGSDTHSWIGTWKMCLVGNDFSQNSYFTCCASNQAGLPTDDTCGTSIGRNAILLGVCPTHNSHLIHNLRTNLHSFEKNTLASLEKIKNLFNGQISLDTDLNNRVSNLKILIDTVTGVSTETRSSLVALGLLIGNVSAASNLGDEAVKIYIGDMLNSKVSPILNAIGSHTSFDPAGMPTESNFKLGLRTKSYYPVIGLGKYFNNTSPGGDYIMMSKIVRKKGNYIRIVVRTGVEVQFEEYRSACNFGKQHVSFVRHHGQECVSFNYTEAELSGTTEYGFIHSSTSERNCDEGIITRLVPCVLKRIMEKTFAVRHRRSLQVNDTIEPVLDEIRKDMMDLRRALLKSRNATSKLLRFEAKLEQKDKESNTSITEQIKQLTNNETGLVLQLKTMVKFINTSIEQMRKDERFVTTTEILSHLAEYRSNKSGSLYKIHGNNIQHHFKDSTETVILSKKMYTMLMALAIFSTVMSCCLLLAMCVLIGVVYYIYCETGVTTEKIKARAAKVKSRFKRLETGLGFKATGYTIDQTAHQVPMYDTVMEIDKATGREGKCFTYIAGVQKWIESSYTYNPMALMLKFKNQFDTVDQMMKVNTSDPFEMMILLTATNYQAFQTKYRLIIGPAGQSCNVFLEDVGSPGKRVTSDTFFTAHNLMEGSGSLA